MRTVLSICAVILCAAVASAEPVVPRVVHVSPDGTVNELHKDGVYRPVPGAAKKGVTAAPVAGGPVVPTVALPTFGGCPGGVCPAPVQPRRGLFRW